MSTPARLGDPCWSREAIGEAISSIARLDPKLTHYFLATHAPIERIDDDRHKATVSELQLFERLVDPAAGDVMAIVHGDPGTGKSHLIRLLHLMCQVEQEEGRFIGMMPVIVQRRTGSLRDALTQIVQQLPAEFERHLIDVREAIATLTAETARQKLANELQLELGPRWGDRGNAPLPAELRGLDELCLSAGFRTWLCRDGGIIDKTIQRLTQESDVFERDTLPRFTSTELSLPERFSPDNTAIVAGLIDEFEFVPELKEAAADHMNVALRPAVKELSGLSGTRLRDVFDAIRRDLKEQGGSLALFIEDVSVMASLDEDILNAIEPNPSADLCRLIAIAGMTEEGFGRLRDNQLDRASEIVSLTTDVMEEWRNDKGGVARFAARYLNALRLDEAALRRIAERRKHGGDVCESACSGCQVQEDCHGTFGAIEFDNVAVGLFPFSSTSPQRLLLALDEQRKGVRRNPRGLLEHVLKPILGDQHSLEERRFPQAHLAVELPELTYWTAFEQQYCGDWSREDRSRLKLLAQTWVNASSSEETARALLPLVEPLGFPHLTREVGQGAEEEVDEAPEVVGGGGVVGVEPERPGTRAPEPDTNPDMQRLLDALSRWMDGARLDHDDEPRRLVHEFVRTAIPWDDEPIPQHVWSTLLADKRCIRFEDQRSRPAGRFFVDLPRSREVSDLLGALGRFDYLGQKSWDFDHAEVHKRSVAAWIRKMRPRIVSSMRSEEIDSDAAMEQAVRFLVIAAVLRMGRELTDDPVEIIREILTDFVPDSIEPLCPEEGEFLRTLGSMQDRVRRFVVSELSRPQGGSTRIMFVDPMPMMAYSKSYAEKPQMEPLDNEYFARSRHWRARYEPLAGVNAVADLDVAMKWRRESVTRGMLMVKTLLSDAGYDVADLDEAVHAYCADIVELARVETDVLGVPSGDFSEVLPQYNSNADTWSAGITAAAGILEQGEARQLLAFNPKTFSDAVRALDLGRAFVEVVEDELDSQERHFMSEGDPSELFFRLREVLDRIEQM